ncbi:MAG TPA: hypothetical protein VF746_12085 [Longimicrobium sp.]|jgi:hypothetical protein
MPPWAKYLLIGCGTLLVLGVVVVGAAVWWISKNSGRIASRMEGVVEEGRRAGSGTDEQGCVGLALAYGGEGLQGMVNVRPFLEGCLRAARETPGFCEAVPQPDEFRRSIAWSTAQCRGSNNPRCSSVMQTKLQYCWEGRPKGTQPVPGIDDSLPSDAAAAPTDAKTPDTEPTGDESVDMTPIDPATREAIMSDTAGP